LDSDGGGGERGGGGRRVEKGELGENMLRVVVGRENKWAPPTRLLLQNSCEARRGEAKRGESAHEHAIASKNP